MIEPIKVPRISVPDANVPRIIAPPVVNQIEQPVLNIPSALIPSYEPIELNPEYGPGIPNFNGGSQQEQEETTEERGGLDVPDIPAAPKQEVIVVPIIDYELPIPRQEQVVLAGTTAFASVGAALIGKKVVDALVKILKPMVRIGLTKAKAAILHQRLSDFEIQQVFAWEKAHPKKVPKNLRKVAKSLKRDQRKELVRQRRVEELKRRQRKSPHKVIEDET